jgi:hypothetical protein
MSPKLDREYRADGSYMDYSLEFVEADSWKPHGVRYRFSWIQNGRCRVLFDNHFGKPDHYHVDEEEFAYTFITVRQLYRDFIDQIKKLEASDEDQKI